MIYILDDEASFKNISKQCDTSFINKDEYKEYVKHILCHTVESIKFLTEKLSKTEDIIFYHKSLQPENGDKGLFAEALDNLRNLLINNDYNYIVFSLGVNSNIKGCCIDKLLFYNNLELFLNNYNETKHYNTKLLYYGSNYIKTDKLNLLYKVLTKIDTIELKRLPREEAFKDLLKKVCDSDFEAKIIEGISKETISKTDIISLLNSKI